MSLDKRTYECSCGYSEDRDIHSAKNMITIKDLVFQTKNFVPTEHREITLAEFKTSVDERSSISQDVEARRC